MNKIILYYNPNNQKWGTLRPVNYSSESIGEIVMKDVPHGCISNVVNDFNLDVLFLSAYDATIDQENINLNVNIDKAKEIWLNHYRIARTPFLQKLDLEYMRVDEVGNLELKKEIAVKKQALRDVTKTELPNDLEGIKNTWPKILGTNPFC